jgi:hypothetical protein
MTMARTGKKPTPKYKRKPPSADPQALALSIHAFCVLHGISEDMYFKMQRQKWGPSVMKVGGRTLISHESAARWRAEREAVTTTTSAAAATNTGIAT